MKKHNVPTVGCDHAPTAAGHEDTKTAHRAVSRGVVYLAALVMLTGACVTTTGEPVVQRPPLEVPPAPPRVITPLPLPELPPVELPVEDPEIAKPPSPTKPKPPANSGKPAETKPETPPVETAPPVAPPPAPATPPPPTLSTPPPQGDANAVSRQIRDNIDRTRRALEKIDYGSLTKERRKAYDDAKLFATQAEEAIKAVNLVFAKELADKAERLAKELQGR